jgi:DNA gyrase/topoisomerase IV subunit B
MGNSEQPWSGLFAVIALHLEDPQFSNQHRDALMNPDIREPVVSLTRQTLTDFLHRYPDEARAILEHIRDPQVVDRKTGQA